MIRQSPNKNEPWLLFEWKFHQRALNKTKTGSTLVRNSCQDCEVCENDTCKKIIAYMQESETSKRRWRELKMKGASIKVDSE